MAKPTFTLEEPRYRGRYSDEINEMFADIEADLQSAYIDNVKLRQTVNELRSAIAKEQVSMSTQLAELESRLETLTTTSGSKIIRRTMGSLSDVLYYPTSLVSRDNQASISTLYSTAYLPTFSEASQLVYEDLETGEVVVNNNIEITVNGYSEGEFGESSGTIEHNDPRNMLDSKPYTFYERRVKFPLYDPQPAVECEIIVDIPPTIDPLANVITLNPYPEGGVSIVSLDYATNASRGAYTSLDTDLASGPIDNAKRKQYRIPSQQIARLRIILKQDKWHVEDGMKVFSYGIRDMDLRRAIYKTPGEFGMRFEIPESVTGYFNQVTGFDPSPVELSNNFSFNLYSNKTNFDAKANGIKLSGVYPIDIRPWLTREVIVGVSIFTDRVDSNSPTLEKMLMEYTTFGV
jgi:hypothetical protein